jgi:hypothetical protein
MKTKISLNPNPENGQLQTSHPLKETQIVQFVKQAVCIRFVNFDVQSEDSPNVVSGVTGHDIVDGSGL